MAVDGVNFSSHLAGGTRSKRLSLLDCCARECATYL